MNLVLVNVYGMRMAFNFLLYAYFHNIKAGNDIIREDYKENAS